MYHNNKNKHQMIYAIDAEKTFDGWILYHKYPFMIKILNKMGIKGTFPQYNQSHLQQRNFP